MGHGAWRMKIITMPNTSLREAAPTTSLRDRRYANAQYKCPMPNAQCPILLYERLRQRQRYFDFAQYKSVQVPNAQLIQNSYERYS